MGLTQSVPAQVKPVPACESWERVLYAMPGVLSNVHGDAGTLGNGLLGRFSADGFVFNPSNHPDAPTFLSGLYQLQMSGIKRTHGQCVSYLLAYGSLVRQYKMVMDQDFSEDECVKAVSVLLAADFQPETVEHLLNQ